MNPYSTELMQDVSYVWLQPTRLITAQNTGHIHLDTEVDPSGGSNQCEQPHQQTGRISETLAYVMHV
jgi:hypothetical protein